MEDFIQYIFILIIVVSFFRRFMKTQKPPQNSGNKTEPFGESKTTPSANYPSHDETPSPARSSADEYAIAREIENMFRKEEEKSQTYTEQPTLKTNQRTKIEEHTQSQSEKTIKVQKVDTSYTVGEHEITSFKRSPKLSQKEETLPLFNLHLRDKLRHPADLKDFIIISEILGKPKAFD